MNNKNSGIFHFQKLYYVVLKVVARKRELQLICNACLVIMLIHGTCVNNLMHFKVNFVYSTELTRVVQGTLLTNC